ncbi:MAG: HAD family hydrolase [Gemmatimonadetes bacterium]|nr:HAD family hydrolase [Gemmatimonadota bacterium]
MKSAVFVDRDGTLIVERCYLADPAGVELLPETGAALRRLQHAGFALVLVTNQSGIARGYYSAADFLAVQRRLSDLLGREGVSFDGVYYCPHHPDFGPSCDCRKPATGLFRRAALDLDIDLQGSAYIGDRIADVEPAAAFGGRGFLVRTGYGAAQAPAAAPWIQVVRDLAEAAEMLAPVDALRPPGG